MDICEQLYEGPRHEQLARNDLIFYAFPFAVPDGLFHIDIPGVVESIEEAFGKMQRA